MTMLSLYLPQLPLHSQLIKVQLNAGAAVPLDKCHAFHPPNSVGVPATAFLLSVVAD